MGNIVKTILALPIIALGMLSATNTFAVTPTLNEVATLTASDGVRLRITSVPSPSMGTPPLSVRTMTTTRAPTLAQRTCLSATQQRACLLIRLDRSFSISEGGVQARLLCS